MMRVTQVMSLSDEVISFLLRRLAGAKPYREGVVGCCCWHDEVTPSLFVYFDDKHHHQWWFKCQGCGKTGPLSFLVKRLKGFHLNLPSVRDTRNFQKQTIEVWQKDPTLTLPAHYSYFRSRGITDAVSKRFRFKMDYHAPGAIMPVYFEGRYRGYIRRNFDPADRRYYISPGLDVSTALWGADAIQTMGGNIFITEGIIDAACLWSIGHQAVALLGKHWDHKRDILHSLASCGRLVVFSDNDRTGLRGFTRLARSLGARLYFPPSQFKDISDWATSDRHGFLHKLKQ